MSVETYIRALPKVDLGVQFDGTYRRDTLLMIADQNDMPVSVKHFDRHVAQLQEPDFAKLNDLLNTVTQWVVHDDDLTRLVYDVGVVLSKQNIRYAEVGINPARYIRDQKTFETFVAALIEGSDKVARGWGVRLQWVLNIPRDEPRRSDEISRWAAGATGRKAAVIGLGLSGNEKAQPVGQFERAFRAAVKKDVARIPHAESISDVEALQDTLHHLTPSRMILGWGMLNEERRAEMVAVLVESDVPVDVSPSQALRLGLVESTSELPLRELYDAGVKLTITAHRPELYGTTLSDEYLLMVNECGFTVDEIEELIVASVRYSSLDGHEKSEMIAEFEQKFADLGDEHLNEAEATAD